MSLRHSQSVVSCWVCHLGYILECHHFAFVDIFLSASSVFSMLIIIYLVCFSSSPSLWTDVSFSCFQNFRRCKLDWLVFLCMLFSFVCLFACSSSAVCYLSFVVGVGIVVSLVVVVGGAYFCFPLLWI